MIKDSILMKVHRRVLKKYPLMSHALETGKKIIHFRRRSAVLNDNKRYKFHYEFIPSKSGLRIRAGLKDKSKLVHFLIHFFPFEV